MVRTLHRGRFLSSAGASIVAICAFMKLLMPSLDAATGAHLFANQGILAGTFFFLVGLLWSRTKPVWQWSLFVLCAFTLWLGISSFLGVAGIGLMRTVEFASYVCVAVVAGYYIRGEISGRIVVGLVGGAAVAVAVWAFGQELLSLPELRESAEKYASQLEADKRADFIDRLMTREVFGPFAISNALAAFCVLVFFPLAACAVALRRNLYACLPAAVTALAVLVTLGLTRSKGGILAFACAAVVSLYFVLGHFGVRRWVRNTVLTVPLVAGVLGVLLLVTYAPSEMGGASAKVSWAIGRLPRR
ncbi:MAG: hypothetical protein U5N86_00935 [Planctomycetota bacterium]|nr:hypothetical protein [Planctomycetota bacterium]